jgi:hypothetical protein
MNLSHLGFHKFRLKSGRLANLLAIVVAKVSPGGGDTRTAATRLQASCFGIAAA